MNVGIFTDCYLPTKNGVSTAVFQAKQELERRGHNVVVLTVTSPSQFDRDSAIQRFPSLSFNHEIEVRLALVRQVAIARIVDRKKLDLIHTHTEFSLGWAGKRAAKRAGLPWVHTLHTLYPAYRHYLPMGSLMPAKAIYGLLARFLRGHDRVVCPSEKMQAYLRGLLPDSRAVLIGNGVSRERFAPVYAAEAERARARARLGIGPAEQVILYVGRLAQEKRVLELLQALRHLLRGERSYRALFVGAGPARERLARAMRAAGLEGQLLLMGAVDWEWMPSVYALADAFVTASLSEVHPMMLIEALACELPIVARRDLGLAGLVRDGYNGFLVDADAEIALRLSDILSDDMTQREFADNARTLSARHTIEKHVDELEALYGQLIVRKRETLQ
jgi:1,2-diacylglycerol 3-alpha-glucosyltransferase